MIMTLSLQGCTEVAQSEKDIKPQIIQHGVENKTMVWKARFRTIFP